MYMYIYTYTYIHILYILCWCVFVCQSPFKKTHSEKQHDTLFSHVVPAKKQNRPFPYVPAKPDMLFFWRVVPAKQKCADVEQGTMSEAAGTLGTVVALTAGECVYVCMYACMYVFTYVCMHACMYVCMYGRLWH